MSISKMLTSASSIGALACASLVLILGVGGLGRAQEKAIKKAPIQASNPGSGQQMYLDYCAVCHGREGKGDGPAASEFKVSPTDLTLLGKNNNGQFPWDHFMAVLRFGVKAPAHGTSDMPIWGPAFRAIKPLNPSSVDQRITNLTNYVKSLQAK